MAPERVRYRFGPLERRGLIAGWRGGQIAAVAGGLVVAVLALRSHPTVASVVVALVSVVGGVALACWPVGGRTGEEWAPTVTRWGWSAAARKRDRRAPAPGAGHRLGPDRVARVIAVPPAQGRRSAPGGSRTAREVRRTLFGGMVLLAAEGDRSGRSFGVVRDERARTYTAVLSVRGHNFALLGPADKERRVGEWAGVLASMSRERSAVHRVQWLALSLPDDGRAVHAYLAGRSVLPHEAAAHRSYAGLVAGAGAATSRHEVMLAVQVRVTGPAARSVRAAGGGDAGGCAVVLREAETLQRRLGEADVAVEGVLDPRALATVIRRAGDPRPPSSDRGVEPAMEGADEEPPRCLRPLVAGWPWPLATDVRWDSLHADGAWHATYWVAEWPRVDVGPDFLGPLLLGSVRRSVSVVMEPLSPSQAVRQVEQARTADLADSELRRRGGFLATARRAREQALVSRREEELADGHASFRFSGYVTVTAPARELLEGACDATEQAAAQCRLELRRLYGEQEQGFTCTLPLGRGLS